MNIPQMAALARDHWKKTNPEIYRQMVEDKALIDCSEAAARLTQREMDRNRRLGRIAGIYSYSGRRNNWNRIIDRNTDIRRKRILIPGHPHTPF